MSTWKKSKEKNQRISIPASFEKNLEFGVNCGVFSNSGRLAVIVADVRGLVFEFSSLVFEFRRQSVCYRI